MKVRGLGSFRGRLSRRERHRPLEGRIELTYRCNLKCVHCYGRGSEDASRELSTAAFRKVMDDIQREGCLWLTLTGGEPLLRPDFDELYLYAKKKGFLVTVFTNACRLNERLLRLFREYPPCLVEVTLNGITRRTYEKVTRVPGSFVRAVDAIRKLARQKTNLIIKANALKENFAEVPRIKKWTEDLLGRPGDHKYFFRYDPMVFPRLDGDRSPLRHRLDLGEIAAMRRADAEMAAEHEAFLGYEFPRDHRGGDFLYHCDSWKNQFTIDPYGRLKFCDMTDKYSVDLNKTPFRHGFYDVFPRLAREKFKTRSACRGCRLRLVCAYCPAKSFLETGREEGPVPYYCELARSTMALDRSACR